MLKLKLQYFGHLMWSTNSLEKTLMLGKTDGKRRRGWQRMSGWMASPTQWTWVGANPRRWWRTGKPGVLQTMWLQRVGCDLATERQYTYNYSKHSSFHHFIRSSRDNPGHDGGVQNPGAHLLSWAHQVYNYYQKSYWWESVIESTRKDLLQLKIQGKIHKETERRGSGVVQSRFIL